MADIASDDAVDAGVLSTPVRDAWGIEGKGEWKWIENVW